MKWWEMPDDAVSSETTRVMLALCRVHARDGRATVTSVVAECGRSRQRVHLQLHRLIDLELVGWDGGPGSLRPLVRAVAAPRRRRRR